MSATKPTDDDRTEKAPPSESDVVTDEKPATGAQNGAAAREHAHKESDEATDDVADADAKRAGEEPAADSEEDEDEEGENLLVRGNPLRWKRGLIAILAGAIPAFLLM